MPSTDDGADPLFTRAPDNGHLVVVQFLIEKGADVNAEDDKGGTSLSRER